MVKRMVLFIRMTKTWVSTGSIKKHYVPWLVCPVV